jgi:hypothetical protein
MKKVKNLLIGAFIMLLGLSSYGQWEKHYYVDKFGDKTNEAFISYTDLQGTFSNSAANNEKLDVDVIISYSKFDDSLPDIQFDLYEYGRGQPVGEAIGKATYSLTIKLANNITQTCSLDPEEQSLSLRYFYKLSFLNHLKDESKPIKCYIKIDSEYGSSTYNFKINPIGFTNALSKIKPK